MNDQNIDPHLEEPIAPDNFEELILQEAKGRSEQISFS